MTQAFAWSESIGTPVIVRITRSLAQDRGPLDSLWELPLASRRFFRRRNRWIALPYLSLAQHAALHRRLRQIARAFEASPYDVAHGDGSLGVLAVGCDWQKLQRVLSSDAEIATMGLSSVFPLPARALTDWLRRRNEVVILEEGGPFVEEQVRALLQREGVPTCIHGRLDRWLPEEGELASETLAQVVNRLAPGSALQRDARDGAEAPAAKALCEDCPYRPIFQTLLELMERHGGRQRYIVVGETGCMVRANLPPMELFDVKYSLGSGLGIALGLAQSDPTHRVVALLGDSSMLHSDLSAFADLSRRQVSLSVLILDNSVTALTGGQAHPASPADERGSPQRAVDLAQVVRGFGLPIETCLASEGATLRTTLERVLLAKGPGLAVVRGPCPRYGEIQG